jgi:hypothetical protein
MGQANCVADLKNSLFAQVSFLKGLYQQFRDRFNEKEQDEIEEMISAINEKASQLVSKCFYFNIYI